jgi:hypothetical protein
LTYQCGPIGPKGKPVGELRVGGEHRRQPIAELLRLLKKNGLKKGKRALVKIARIAAELSASAWRFA